MRRISISDIMLRFNTPKSWIPFVKAGMYTLIGVAVLFIMSQMNYNRDYNYFITANVNHNNNLFLTNQQYANEEFPICAVAGDQQLPDVYRNIVVWQDNRNGNWDIYGYDLNTKREFQITTNTADQCCADVYGNIIVWADKRNNKYGVYSDIYDYNISTRREFRITSDSGNVGNPKIYGDIVVWGDYTNSNAIDIYGYNLSTEEKFQITKDTPYNETVSDFYGDIVVWEDGRNKDSSSYNSYDNWDIYGYDISTRKEFQVTKNTNRQEYPAIYGNLIIYRSWGESPDIWGYNLLTKEEFVISSNPSNEGHPAIYENIVVWEDDRNGNDDIYGYDIDTKQEFIITEAPNDQMLPKIYDNIACWQDNRKGNWDIYCAKFSLSTISPTSQKQTVPSITYRSETPRLKFSIGIILTIIIIVLLLGIAIGTFLSKKSKGVIMKERKEISLEEKWKAGEITDEEYFERKGI